MYQARIGVPSASQASTYNNNRDSEINQLKLELSQLQQEIKALQIVRDELKELS